MEIQDNASAHRVDMMMVKMNNVKNATKLGIYLFIHNIIKNQK